MKNKPNGIIMAEAIMDEERAAYRQKRTPCSANAIQLFRCRTKRKLSDEQVEELFGIVFNEYRKISGARIGSTNN